MSSSTLGEYTGIHSTVPDDFNPQGGFTFEYDAARERVLIYLMERAGEVRTAFKIAVACGYPQEGSQARLRKAIKEINHIFSERGVRAAVVSTPRGFYYTCKADDVRASIERHRSRVKGLSRTIRDEMSILERLGGSTLVVEAENEYE